MVTIALAVVGVLPVGACSMHLMSRLERSCEDGICTLTKARTTDEPASDVAAPRHAATDHTAAPSMDVE